MTTGIAQTASAATDVTVVQNQAAASASHSACKAQEVSKKDSDAASVECSERGRVRNRCHDHHHRRHCDDGSVGEIVDDLSRLSSRLGKVQSKIDDGDLSADGLAHAEEHAQKLTAKLKKLVNSDEFKKANDTVKAVLEAYNSEGKEAALEIARQNRDVLGHDFIHALKHGRTGRLEKISAAFDTINSIVNPEPPAPETPVVDEPVVESNSDQAAAALAKKAVPSPTAVTIEDTAPAKETPSETSAKAAEVATTTAAETATTTLDLSALSKALSNARGALGRWHHRAGHDETHFAGIAGGSRPILDQKGLEALANQIKANQTVSTTVSTGLDPLKSLDLLQA